MSTFVAFQKVNVNIEICKLREDKRIRTEMVMYFNSGYIHDRVVMKGMNI
jgi:DNA-directed RNA polymerase alpha subunit